VHRDFAPTDAKVVFGIAGQRNGEGLANDFSVGTLVITVRLVENVFGEKRKKQEQSGQKGEKVVNRQKSTSALLNV
jgi:hypothetical protein